VVVHQTPVIASKLLGDPVQRGIEGGVGAFGPGAALHDDAAPGVDRDVDAEQVAFLGERDGAVQRPVEVLADTGVEAVLHVAA
jgi:hypothetical protein